MPYASHLIDIACSRDMVPGAAAAAAPATITDPADFISSLFRYIAISNAPITRLGMDQMIDALFALPELTQTLDDAVATDIQNRFEADWLPQASSIFKAHWTHIILPAWSQHRDIARACAASASASASASAEATR